MKILLFGANGQLGRAFQELSESEAFPVGWTLRALSSRECDLSEPSALQPILEQESPDLILNSAAYTAVDLAESEQDRCSAVNAAAPALMARFCKARGIPLVHYSSDYVYSGEGNEPRGEDEPLGPLNHYGRSKAEGDRAIQDSGCEHLIFRTSWVFSHLGKNFVKTVLRIGTGKSELRIVDDQVGSPTYAPDLAKVSLEALMRALESKALGAAFPSGVYHLTNSGFTSWAGFARAILPGIAILPITTREYPTPAARPLNSRLSLSRLKTTFGLSPRPWQDALSECLKRIKESSNAG